MIETLYSTKGIWYRVTKNTGEPVKVFTDINHAIDYDSAIPEVHYSIMDDLSDLEFMGRTFRAAKPRFCNGSYAMFEYELSDPVYLSGGTYWIVTTMERHVMAVFVLREQAMKYIHDKECRT